MSFHVFVPQMVIENVLFLGIVRGAGSATKNDLMGLLFSDTVKHFMFIISFSPHSSSLKYWTILAQCVGCKLTTSYVIQ